MPILALLLVTYLLEGLINVPVLQPNATSYIDPVSEDCNFCQDDFENMPTACSVLLYRFTENQSMVNVRNVRNCVQTDISTDSNVHHENEREIRENGKIKEEFLGYAAQNFHVFDPDWDLTFSHHNHSVPNIIMNLYQTMETINSKNFLPKFDIIRCLHVTEHAYMANGIIIKFGFNGTQNAEQIVGTELYIYRIPQPFKKASTDFNIIRLYQILSKETMNPRNSTQNIDIHELLGVTYISPYDQGWQIFNVEKSLEKWNWNNGEPTLNFLISVTDTWGNIIDPTHFGLEITKSSNSPLLVVRLRQFSDSAMVKTFNKKVTFYENVSAPKKLETPSPTTCNRRPFHIDFKKEPFSNFIIYPEGLMVHKCTGKCQLQLIDNFTNHAKLLNIFQQKSTGSEVSESYCVPNEYVPATLVFYDRYSNIVIKKYYDVIVNSCSCR